MNKPKTKRAVKGGRKAKTKSLPELIEDEKRRHPLKQITLNVTALPGADVARKFQEQLERDMAKSVKASLDTSPSDETAPVDEAQPPCGEISQAECAECRGECKPKINFTLWEQVKLWWGKGK